MHNHIKGRKVYTTYRNNPQDGVGSPTLFNIYTADILPFRAPIQVMSYVDSITIAYTQTRVQQRNTHTYIHNFFPG